MEYEIVEDTPEPSDSEGEGASRDGGIVEDHIALINQSSVSPEDYPAKDRAASSLVGRK